MRIPIPLVVVAALSALGVVVYTWQGEPTADSAVSDDAVSVATTTSQGAEDLPPITREPSSTDREVYINQKWRFSFEYPEGWEVISPVFGGPVTLFNMSLNDPNKFMPVTINITQKEWIDGVLSEFQQKGVNTDPESIASIEADIVEDTDWLGRSAQSAYILINDEYWIDISVTNSYETERELIRSTFRFHEPLPTLEELGIEPYVP